jgi:FkbM family methyltransferase
MAQVSIKKFWNELIDEDYKIKVIDIGAAEGEDYSPSYQPLIDLEIANIIGFEPNKEACEVLNSRAKEESHYLPYFIGDGKVSTFYETNWPPTSSLFRPNTKLLEKFNNLAEVIVVQKEHQVQTHRLDDIQEIDGVDFLKMDIQGAELKALKNGVNLLNKALVVQVEVEFVELYQGQPLFSDIDSFLRSEGFQFHCFDSLMGRALKPIIKNNNPSEEINQVLWADAFYVKDWMNLEQISREQLITFAILTYFLLGSIDLTHFILTHLDKVYNSNFSKKFLNILTSN